MNEPYRSDPIKTYCTNCRFCKKDIVGLSSEFWKCVSPKNELDPVTGKIKSQYCEYKNTYANCKDYVELIQLPKNQEKIPWWKFWK